MIGVLKRVFSPYVPSNERQDEANRAENEGIGHAGLDAPVVTVGRKFAHEVVA